MNSVCNFLAGCSHAPDAMLRAKEPNNMNAAPEQSIDKRLPGPQSTRVIGYQADILAAKEFELFPHQHICARADLGNKGSRKGEWKKTGNNQES
jgi:hypothetical protein